jgi:hypothetical protein
MIKKLENLSIFEFQEHFKTDSDCLKFLAEVKWQNGYTCLKCGHNKYSKGQMLYSRKCTKCNHQESPTANTLFHKIKFSILKAFWIIYYISVSKKGISSTELSRLLNLRQMTCWLFKRKVMEATHSKNDDHLNGTIEVDEFIVGGKREGKPGRSKSDKKEVVVAVKLKGRGIAEARCAIINGAGTKQLRPFFDENIAKDANIRTDKWRGYTPLRRDYENLTQEKSAPKRNFKFIHRFIMGFKGWLRGIHHSVRSLQAYLNEYTYRFNRHLIKNGLFEEMIQKMVIEEPKTRNRICYGN